ALALRQGEGRRRQARQDAGQLRLGLWRDGGDAGAARGGDLVQRLAALYLGQRGLGLGLGVVDHLAQAALLGLVEALAGRLVARAGLLLADLDLAEEVGGGDGHVGDGAVLRRLEVGGVVLIDLLQRLGRGLLG